MTRRCDRYVICIQLLIILVARSNAESCRPFENALQYKIRHDLCPINMQVLSETVNTHNSATLCTSFCFKLGSHKAVWYQASTKTCQCLTTRFEDDVWVERCDDGELLHSKNTRIVYPLMRISRQYPTSVYNTWTAGQALNADNVTLMSTTLNPEGVYVSNNLPSLWQSLTQVTVAFVTSNQKKAWVTFNKPSGATLLDWFAPANVINSSYTDITTTIDYEYFSIAGDVSIKRRFFIHVEYLGCDVDVGWIVVLDGSIVCPWESNGLQFMYCSGTTRCLNQDMLQAEVLFIYGTVR